MDASLKLGRLLGIPFGINYSWFLVFAMVTGSLALVYFPDAYPEWGLISWWLIGLATSLLFFASVLAHELAHSRVSIASGIPVVSITLFIFGGMAKVSREADKPGAELLMALAGPACSAALAGFFAAIWFLFREASEPLAAVALWLSAINVSLALFNMVPGFPLDGGRVLRALLWHFSGDFRKATKIAALAGRVIAYIMVFGGLLGAFYQYWDGLWFAVIGWFLERAAVDAYRQVSLRQDLGGARAAELIHRHLSILPANTPVAQAAAKFGRFSHPSVCLVEDGGTVVGLVTADNIKAISDDRKEVRLLRDIMIPWDQLSGAHPDDNISRVIDLMGLNHLDCVPVVDCGDFVGLVDLNSIDRFTRRGRRWWGR